jgi:general secretion pathway protein D
MKAARPCSGNKIKIIIIIITIVFIFSGINKNSLLNNDCCRSQAFAQETGPKPDKATVKEIETKNKYFTLNFKDVEIIEFINMMSQLIGKNVIVDEKVRGKITITSVKKFPVSHAYDIFMSILEVKGLAAVETSSGLIKIIPVKDAIKKNAEIVVDGKSRDVQTKEEKTVTYLFTVKYSDANEIATALRSLKSNNVDIVVYQSLNTIIMSGVSSEIDGLVKIAQELDKEIKDKGDEEKVSSGNIHIYHLENADAEQLAAVLSRIPFSETAKIAQGPINPPNQNVNPGMPGEQPSVRASARAARTTRTQPTAASAAQTGKLSIIPNKETNSLVIYATPEEYNEIKRIIKELDIVREQVLIEALIVEISADKSWNLGIDWMVGGKSGGNAFGGSSIMGTPPSFGVPSGVTLPAGKEMAMPLATGFQLGFLSSEKALSFALLSLSETDKNFNILSTPQILTIDNHEAELNIGSEIPVTSNTRITDTNTVFNTYEYKSVGLKLKITPHITKTDRITLDLYQEANDVLGATNSKELPTLTKRDIQTKVTVYDGKTVVIGGLIKNNKNVEETKVPLLGDIPILGWLFKRKSVSYVKTNLLVFITPHIVTKPDRMDAITEQKQEEMKRSGIK